MALYQSVLNINIIMKFLIGHKAFLSLCTLFHCVVLSVTLIFNLKKFQIFFEHFFFIYLFIYLFLSYLTSPNVELTFPGTYSPYARGSDAYMDSNRL